MGLNISQTVDTLLTDEVLPPFSAALAAGQRARRSRSTTHASSARARFARTAYRSFTLAEPADSGRGADASWRASTSTPTPTGRRAQATRPTGLGRAGPTHLRPRWAHGWSMPLRRAYGLRATPAQGGLNPLVESGRHVRGAPTPQTSVALRASVAAAAARWRHCGTMRLAIDEALDALVTGFVSPLHVASRPIRSQYEDFMRHVSTHGVAKTDRTGTGTSSVFGYQMRFDLNGLPAGDHQEGAPASPSSSNCCGSCAATATRAGCRSAASRSGTNGRARTATWARSTACSGAAGRRPTAATSTRSPRW